MKTSVIVVCLLPLFLGCERDRPDPDRLAKAKKAKEAAAMQLSKEAQSLEAASKNIAERLKKMNKEDQATVAALIMMMEATGSLDGRSISLRKETSNHMAENIRPVSVEIAKAWETRSLLGGCFDESIAYATAMAKCENDGKKESECYTAMEASSAEIGCMMKQIEELRKNAFDIFAGLKPPGPTPWPEM